MGPNFFDTLSRMLRYRYANQGRLEFTVLNWEISRIGKYLLNEPGQVLVYLGVRRLTAKPYAVIIQKNTDSKSAKGIFVVYTGTALFNIQSTEAKIIYKQIGNKYNFDAKGIINLESNEDGLHDYAVLMEFLTNITLGDLSKEYIGVTHVKYLGPNVIGQTSEIPASCLCVYPLRLTADKSFHDGNSILNGSKPKLILNVMQFQAIILSCSDHWFYGFISYKKIAGSYDSILNILIGHNALFKTNEEYNTVKEKFFGCMMEKPQHIIVSRFENRQATKPCSSEPFQYISSFLHLDAGPNSMIFHSTDAEACKREHDPIILMGKALFNVLEDMSDFSQSLSTSQSQPIMPGSSIPVEVEEIIIDDDTTSDAEIVEEVESVNNIEPAEIDDEIPMEGEEYDPIFDQEPDQSSGSDAIREIIMTPPSRQLTATQNYEELLQKAREDIIYSRFFDFPVIRLKPRDGLSMNMSNEDVDIYLQFYQEDFERRIGETICCVPATWINGEELRDISGITSGKRFIVLVIFSLADIVTVFIDAFQQEYISFGSKNLTKKDPDVRKTLEEGLETLLPQICDYTHTPASVMCTGYRDWELVHVFLCLNTITSYMTHYVKLPIAIIYPGTLVRQMVYYLTLSRSCANMEYNQTVNEGDHYNIPVAALPTAEKSVLSLNMCPFCAKRKGLNGLRGVFRHIEMDVRHLGRARETAKARYSKPRINTIDPSSEEEV